MNVCSIWPFVLQTTVWPFVQQTTMNVCSIWPFTQISDDFYYLGICQCARYFVAALFKELALITIRKMWVLESRSRTSRSQSRLLSQSLDLVSKFEPGLGLWGYGFDYITDVHYSCPPSKQAQKVSFISIQTGCHNRTHRNSQSKWEFEFESILLSNLLILYRANSVNSFRCLICLSNQHRIAFSTRKNCNLFAL